MAEQTQFTRQANQEVLIGKVIRGAKSILKTTILKKDRLGQKLVEERLAICRKCPSGFAVFRKGKLRSCGKLFGSGTQNSLKSKKLPCGCLLRFKALDTKENCPMGHWPNRDNKRDMIELQTCKDQQDYSKQTGSDTLVAANIGLIEQHETRKRRFLDVGKRKQRIARRQLEIAELQLKLPERNNEQARFKRQSSRLQIAVKRPEIFTVSKHSQSTKHSFSLFDFFDRVVVVNLDRRTDRLDRFYRHIADVGWPFRYPERFRAIDGKVIKPPTWWRPGAAAWGCQQSHLRIIENAMLDGVNSLLVLEDDVFFVDGFHQRVADFLRMLPDDWQQAYLGGQHLLQYHKPPIQINEHVLQAFNINRTHAYALHKRGMNLTYRWLSEYVEQSKWPKHHIDHRFGALHESGKIKVFAPTEWIAGQCEGMSNIRGNVQPSRLWPAKKVEQRWIPFVAVIGLHRSGSSCTAGVLHKLGIHMGDRLGGYESTGGFEAVGLARICEAAFPFPSTERRVSKEELYRQLREHIRHVQRSAKRLGRQFAGGKYPQLCAMGDELIQICGDGLKIIHINRSIDESIQSLTARSQRCSGFLHQSPAHCEKVQRWLWECKQSLLSQVGHLEVNYDDLISDPLGQIHRIVEFLQLQVSDEQIADAVDHVRPELRVHRLA